MDKDAIIQRFAALFRGRLDAYGTDEGSCRWVRDAPTMSTYLYGIQLHLFPLTHFYYHPLGVYPTYQIRDGGEFVVNWGCVDFDEGYDVSWADALNLHNVMSELDMDPWIERSRSKGYHVWTFAAEPIPAEVMRRSLQAACQLVDAPQKEVNPKQVTLAEGKVGNYVRLPYPRGNVDRQVMLDVNPRAWHYDQEVVTLEQFVEAAEQVPRATYEDVAQLWVPPAKPPFNRRVVAPSTLDGTAERRLSGLAYTIWQYGPLEGADRSGTLWKLAQQIHEDGNHTRAEAVELLHDADSRWGKYLEADRPDELDRIMQKVWG